MELQTQSWKRGFRLGATGAGIALACLLHGLAPAEAMVEFWQVFKVRYPSADILKFGDSGAEFFGRCNACHTGFSISHYNHNRYKMDVFHGCQSPADGCKNPDGSPAVIPACTAMPFFAEPSCLAPPWDLDARFAAVEGLDSDGDGWTNKQELDALTLPGDPSDLPRLGALTASSFVVANESDDEPSDNQHAVVTAVVNTPAGTNVAVAPHDASSGTQPVTLTFAAVGQPGWTSLVTSSAGPEPPAGFQLGSPPIFYELTTSAAYSPPVSVCIDYSGVAFADEANLRLFHYESGAWMDRTVSLDTATDVVCASVDSLSPFAVFERTDLTAPRTAAQLSPEPNAFGWSNAASVTVALQAQDEAGGSGVQAIFFTLSGAETGRGRVSGGAATVAVTAEGVTTLSYFARDASGNEEPLASLSIRIDRTGPVVSGMPSDCVLWPPNHRLVHVATVAASDGLSGLAARSPQLSATSSEPDDRSGGRTSPDVVIEGGAIWLRAERSGSGAGRVYEIRAVAGDLAGNRTEAAATCHVPHDRSRR